MFLTHELSRDEEAHAAELHRQSIVIDTLGALRPTDEYIASVRAGGVTGIGLTVGTYDTMRLTEAIEWLQWWDAQIEKRSHDLVVAETADDIRQAKADDRIAVVYLFQSGRQFDDNAQNVDLFRELRITSSQLTYNRRNFLGDGHTEPGNAGLSTLGHQVVARMNAVGMLVDLSHTGDQTAQDIIRTSTKPVYYSHVSARAVYEDSRNVSPETLGLLVDHGGYVSSMASTFSADPEQPLKHMFDHVAYFLSQLGDDLVMVSTDFLKGPEHVYRNAWIDAEGYLNVPWGGDLQVERFYWRGGVRSYEYPWWVYPTGLKTYHDFANVTRELVARGLSDDQIKGVLGENYLRLYETVVG